MAPGKLRTSCHIHLEPEYDLHGRLISVKATRLSQRAPRTGHSVKLDLVVPASAFEPFKAQVDVPESAVQCKVIPITKEQGEPE